MPVGREYSTGIVAQLACRDVPKAGIAFALEIARVSMKAVDVEGSDLSAAVMGLGFRCNPPLPASILHERRLCQGWI